MFKITRLAATRESRRMFSSYETLKVTSPKAFVAHVELNRPERLNSLSFTMWEEIGKCFRELGSSPDVRSIVLTGAGKHFCAGIDLMGMLEMSHKITEASDVVRKGKIFEDYLTLYQESFSSIEKCPKPVIAATHSAVVGAGLDMITAADIRYCTRDCWYSVKEVDIGMAADVGTLQRLPKIIGSQSLVRELCFTARKFTAEEALKWGLVNRVFENKEELVEASLKLAEEIANKSPVAVQATKSSIVYSLDHTNQEGLDHIRSINKLNLQSEDFFNAVVAGQSKGEMPTFAKL